MKKKVIENYMNEVWNKKNLSVISHLFSNDAIIHSPIGEFRSPLRMSETVSHWFKAIPDIQIELLNTLEDNGIVSSHWRAKGTHENRSVTYHGVSMYRFDKDKVVEYWAFLDHHVL